MANAELINLIIETVANMLEYMLPVIGLLSGLVFILSFFYQVTFGALKNIR